MNIIITGGAGFIGSNLSNELCKRRHSVYIIDNLEEQIHGKIPSKSFTYRSLCGRINRYVADINNSGNLNHFLGDHKYIDSLVHLAAETGTGQSMYQARRYFETNVTGTVNLFESIRRNNIEVGKFILASSRSVYGEGKYICKVHGTVFPGSRHFNDMKKNDYECKCPICGEKAISVPTDELSKLNPASFYALTKQMQEDTVKYYCGLLKIPFIIFRMQNVYGVGQSLSNPYTGIISIFSSLFSSGAKVEIFEDGAESRDFVNINDVVQGYVLAIESKKIENQIINLGSGSSTPVIKLARVLKKMLASDSKIEITGAFRVGDIRHNLADITKAKNLLNYKPRYLLGKGLKLFINWVKNSNVQQINYDESLKMLRKKNLLMKPS